MKSPPPRLVRSLAGARTDAGSPSKAKGAGATGEGGRRIHVSGKCLSLALLLSAAIVFSAGAMWRIFALHPHLVNRPRAPDAQAAHINSPSTMEGKEDVHPNGSSSKEETEDEHTFHLPAGHHLLVDIKHVDPSFLASEELLTDATYELIRASNQELLSFHCYRLAVGLSCIGVLKDSHITLRTWPQGGAILLDLYTRGREPLLPVLPTVEKLFAVPSQELLAEPPQMIWSHKLRGFRDDEKLFENPLEQDIGADTLQKHRAGWVKTLLASDETDFQRVHVVGLEKPNSLPDKILYLDGFAQSSLLGEVPYHEALVHPAMISHPNPRRVAIIGGGEGATLREVLKHKTVEEVVMVEIDEELVELCEEYLPEWSDCSDFSDEDSCFEDERATVIFADAFGWFIDRYSNEETEEEKFDVIIQDALDPDKFVEIVGSLYKNDEFVASLFHGLSEEGVFVMQSGQCDALSDPGDDSGQSKDEAHMYAALRSVGFQSAHYFAEGHSKYYAPWAYQLLFKDAESIARWYKTSAEIDVELHKRLSRSKSGKPALGYFDASTMSYYQLPPKADEATYCRKEITPEECGRIDEYIVEAQVDPGSSGKFCHVPPNSLPIIEKLHQWATQNIGSHIEDEISGVAAIAQDQSTCKVEQQIRFSPVFERHMMQTCRRLRF